MPHQQGDTVTAYSITQRLLDENSNLIQMTDPNGNNANNSYAPFNHISTNQTQAIVWRWEGEAFGNTPAQELTGVSVNLRFPGQYYDQEANLHYNWNRYYDPSIGRYITSDPIGLDGGFNPYSYVGQNSINRIDSTGEWVVPVIEYIAIASCLLNKFTLWTYSLSWSTGAGFEAAQQATRIGHCDVDDIDANIYGII